MYIYIYKGRGYVESLKAETSHDSQRPFGSGFAAALWIYGPGPVSALNFPKP